MRKTIGPGLAVVPTFEDMIGNPPAVKTAPPPLKYSDIMDNPLYQSLFNSFRTIETTQELVAQKQLLNVTIPQAAIRKVFVRSVAYRCSCQGAVWGGGPSAGAS
ncbi:MAG UNVERIFIED_CONTAM: hypothetical protein LVR18_42570 [Planctomycetaceae bacterium]|jgi:hypothetical protein